ncbi:MAG TPA: SpoIIE family protein phosphatase, partial [Solirubrobacteraceae bacterium]
AAAHVDPAREAAAWELRRRYPVSAEGAEGLPVVLRDGTSWLQPAVTREDLEASAHDPEHLRLLEEVGFGSVLVVPMLAGPRIVGAITLVSDRPDRFDRGDVALAEELGRRAGGAVHNARLNRERAEIAHTLQTSLLPDELPRMSRWQTASLYRPTGEANEVGGDFYDGFAVKDGWVVVVGDVAGKGARAAAVTGLARHTLRTGIRLSGRVAPAFEELNAALRAGPELALCTVAGVRLGDGYARVFSAGHPLPILIRDGQARPVGQTGPLLGAYGDADWPATDLDLRPADVLVLYTDGVIDAVRDDGERFGEQRLLEAVVAASPTAEATVTAIGRALDRFSLVGQRDDVAVVAVAWQGVLEVREELPHGEDSPAVARRAVARSLNGTLPEPVLDRVLVLTSELVTNAIRHGGAGPIELHARVDTLALRVEVRDTGTGFVPEPPRPGPHGGFGLLLVGEGADRWGVEAGQGSCVWFEIDLARPG